MSLYWPEGTKNWMDLMRELVGRGVIITVKEGQIACTVCSLDPVTNTSTDAFCPACSGLYWIPIYSGYTVSGHVRWGFADRANWQVGGIIPEGDCKVTIEYTTANLDHVQRSYNWLVDGKTLYMEKFQLKGIRGDDEEHIPSRIAVYLKEEED
jgi:hypothetical protein